jgi:hypothetical protein
MTHPAKVARVSLLLQTVALLMFGAYLTHQHVQMRIAQHTLECESVRWE